MYRIIFGILLFSFVAFSQDFLITGVVVDDVGQPISEAKVELEGTTLYSMSDDTGYFKIEGIPTGNENSYRVPKTYNQPIFLYNWFCFSIFNENASITFSVYTLKGRLLHESFVGKLSVGNYQYPTAHFFGKYPANGFYLIKVAIDKSIFTYKVLYANQKFIGSDSFTTGSITNHSPSQAFNKAISAQPTGILKITKTGYFIQKIPLNTFTANVGSVPVNRAQDGQEPSQFKLQIALDSLFTSPIFVSPAIDDMHQEHTAVTSPAITSS